VRFDQRHEAELAIQKFNAKFPSDNSEKEPLCIKFASCHVDSNNSKILSNLSIESSQKILPNTSLSFLNASVDFFGPSSDSLISILNTPSLLNNNFISTQAWGLNSSNQAGWALFVYNLASDAQDSLLYQLFAPFGAIKSLRIIRNQTNQKCKGYAFVNMRTHEEAIDAITALNGISIGNRVLQVSFKTN
jgi:ELAV like protein 2/3/4